MILTYIKPYTCITPHLVLFIPAVVCCSCNSFLCTVDTKNTIVAALATNCARLTATIFACHGSWRGRGRGRRRRRSWIHYRYFLHVYLSQF